ESPPASRRSRTPTWRWWEKLEKRSPGRRRSAAPGEDALAVLVQRGPRHPLPALLRDRRLLHVPGGREERAAVRRARRGGDGHLVVDQHLRWERDAARALARNARAPRRRPLPVLAGDAADDDRDVVPRHLLDGGHALLGAGRVRDPRPRRALGTLLPVG